MRDATDSPRVVLVTAPDAGVAREIGRALVDAGHAACANVVAGVTSIYRWEGEVQEDPEVLLVVKTTAGRMADVERTLAARHPYDVPECVALEPASVEARYLAWLRASVG